MAENLPEKSLNFAANSNCNSNQSNIEAIANRDGYGSINSVPISETSEGCFLQFDDILNSIGEFGFWQKVIYFLTCVVVNVPTAMQLSGVFFTSGTPKFQCATPKVECDVDKCCDNCTKYDYIEHFTTTTTEYNLICDRAYIAANVQAGFMAGMLVGSFIFGVVSDIIGRRSCMLLCSLLMTAFGLGSVYTHSLVLFTILRFATATSMTGLFIVQYVYTLEIVGRNYRTTVGLCSLFFWTAGEEGVTLMAYYIRDWRTLLLVISCPPALFILLWPIIPESPRWLVVQGRTEEASHVLMKFSGNKRPTPVDSDLLGSALESLQRGEDDSDSQATKVKNSPLDLLRTPRVRKRTLILWFNWMVVALACFGFVFYASDLAGSSYLNVALMYATDVPGVLITWITVKKFGRRHTNCFCMVAGGVACLVVLAVPTDQTRVRTALILIGRLFCNASFNVLFLYASELYPTSIRNLAVGSCSTFARVGAIAAPYVVMLAQLPGVSVTFPMLVFGVLTVTAGLMTLWLPETLDSNMCQTIEEVNLAEEYYGFIWMGKRIPNPFSCFRSSIVDVNSSMDVPSSQEFATENSPLIN